MKLGGGKLEVNGVSIGTVKGVSFSGSPPTPDIRPITDKLAFSAEFDGHFDCEALNRIFHDHESAERLTRYFGTPTMVNGCAPL